MANEKNSIRVVISKDGPYIVQGNVQLSEQIIGTDTAGASETWVEVKTYPEQENYALCRCGNSETKPFCSGKHAKIEFNGAETASRQSYLNQANVLDGSKLNLTDADSLCASARFCDPHGSVWNQVSRTDNAAIRESFIRQVGNCPSGRLVAWDKTTGKALEPELAVSISLVQDPQEQCSGPIWLRGGIPVVSEDGFEYEVRNRVTLCRCGQSKNKPFCDGTHVAIKFRSS